MLMELSVEKVIEIVGPGAAWPNLDREAIVSEIFLEIEAGSSGRPNAAQELANLERVSPLLVQTPGISPRWLANKVPKLVDSHVDLDEAFSDVQIGRAPCGARGGPSGENSGAPVHVPNNRQRKRS